MFTLFLGLEPLNKYLLFKIICFSKASFSIFSAQTARSEGEKRDGWGGGWVSRKEEDELRSKGRLIMRMFQRASLTVEEWGLERLRGLWSLYDCPDVRTIRVRKSKPQVAVYIPSTAAVISEPDPQTPIHPPALSVRALSAGLALTRGTILFFLNWIHFPFC